VYRKEEALSRKRKRGNPGMQGGKRKWRLCLGGNGNAVHMSPGLLKTPHMFPVVFFSYYYFVNLTTLALGFFNGLIILSTGQGAHPTI